MTNYPWVITYNAWVITHYQLPMGICPLVIDYNPIGGVQGPSSGTIFGSWFPQWAPKGAKRRPKGAKRCPKATTREPQGAQWRVQGHPFGSTSFFAMFFITFPTNNEAFNEAFPSKSRPFTKSANPEQILHRPHGFMVRALQKGLKLN